MRAFVDRIESGIATLLLGEDESFSARLPVALLPKGIREGTVLRIAVSVDEDATTQGKRAVRDVMDSLGNEV